MRYVVLGASAAGVSGARELRKNDNDAEIIMISKDEKIYSRCILHHLLEGIRNVEQLTFVEKDFEERYNINWKKGVSVNSLNRRAKKLELSNGETLSYDKLLIATGASTFIPPIEGLREAKNALGFRNLEDAQYVKEKAKECKNIVVMGAGLVGIDVITGLCEYNTNLYLVEMADRMLSRQLDKKASIFYEKAFEKQGVKQYYSIGLKALDMKDGYITYVELTNGDKIPCDMLIVTAGVRANVAFLENSGIETDKFGLILDENCSTNDSNVFGAGDVTGKSPIWPMATKQGIVAGRSMTGITSKLDDFFASKSTMNFLGIPSMSLGVCEPEDDTYEISIQEDEINYKKVIHKNGKIYGAIIVGDLSYTGVLTQIIAHKIDISKIKKSLFKIDYSDFFNLDRSFEFFYD